MSFVDEYRANAAHLAAEGLYDPAEEHDACGVGFVAAIDGKPRREVVEAAINALKSVWHRGAVDADGKTGDGAGIHVQIPQDFFREHIERTGHRPRPGQLAVGMIFLPRTDLEGQERCRSIVEAEILNLGYVIYGWRQVPVNIDIIGEKANATRPEIEQIMLADLRGTDPVAFERNLYVLRRRIEKRAIADQIKDFYICSFSCRSIIYKGMFLAEQLTAFYPDLLDERFVSSFAIYHQRYSTNTFPTWPLAQPFRILAHNGEINTLRGNINWMKSHETRLASVAFGDHIDDIKPVIQVGGSDSAALDAVMEPWDGPAALAMTDGRWVLGGMDRNGLRPMRYAVTAGGLIVAGSEAGMVRLDETEIVEKGRLGPGQMIGVDLATGRLYRDREIKDQLAAKRPYAAWVENITALDSLIKPARGETAGLARDELRRRQVAFGWSLEDLELILQPMAEDGKEAVGSMGDDTPLAVLSEHYRGLHHFFRQNFSQITNPPIDSLREKRVMSLKTRLGNLGNILDEDATQCQLLQLDSPVLSNAEFTAMRAYMGDTVAEIDCTFEIDGGEAGLREAIWRIRQESEDAVRRGCAHVILSDAAVSKDRAAIPMILATGAVHSHLVRQQ